MLYVTDIQYHENARTDLVIRQVPLILLRLPSKTQMAQMKQIRGSSATSGTVLHLPAAT